MPKSSAFLRSSVFDEKTNGSCRDISLYTTQILSKKEAFRRLSICIKILYPSKKETKHKKEGLK
jgi:hypothetical protein